LLIASAYVAAEAFPGKVSDREFWNTVVNFSEAGGAFRSAGAVRSDNLISNETSFQQVFPALLRAARQGAYLGVGPDQNLTYIAALRPKIAFIIDIRRDNMLLHLLYKALIEMSADRVDFLSYLFARPRPAGVGHDSTAQALFDAFRPVPESEELATTNLRAVFDRLERMHRFTLSREDESSIKDAYNSFCLAGPDIRWDSSGDSWIPSYADLMTQRDRQGRPHSYLASEESFRVLKEYETRNRIVPLVGDFSGEKTLRAVGLYLKKHDVTVAAFYRWVARLPFQNVPAYSELGVRLEWRASDRLDLSVNGENLLHERHAEFGSGAIGSGGAGQVRMRRSIHAKAAFRW
jgi:hypothetical protein